MLKRDFLKIPKAECFKIFLVLAIGFNDWKNPVIKSHDTVP